MRAAILPEAIILTEAQTVVTSMLAKRCYCGLEIASEVFLVFTTQLYLLCTQNALLQRNCYFSFFFNYYLSFLHMQVLPGN